MEKYKILDLFSGLGGFSLGLERTGHFETVAFCDNNQYSKLILDKHWKGVKIYDDVREISKEKFREDGIEFPDIITGGFPCQPFSVAGKQKGTSDDRHLWPEMFRIIKAFKPRYVIGENVRGIVNIQEGVVFETVCTDLESEGYEVQPFIIPAAGVGAPHRRERVWIIANREESMVNSDNIRFQQHSTTKEESSWRGTSTTESTSSTNVVNTVGNDERQEISRSDEETRGIQEEHRTEHSTTGQSSRTSAIRNGDNGYESMENSNNNGLEGRLSETRNQAITGKESSVNGSEDTDNSSRRSDGGGDQSQPRINGAVQGLRDGNEEELTRATGVRGLHERTNDSSSSIREDRNQEDDNRTLVQTRQGGVQSSEHRGLGEDQTSLNDNQVRQGDDNTTLNRMERGDKDNVADTNDEGVRTRIGGSDNDHETESRSWRADGTRGSSDDERHNSTSTEVKGMDVADTTSSRPPSESIGDIRSMGEESSREEEGRNQSSVCTSTRSSERIQNMWPTPKASGQEKLDTLIKRKGVKAAVQHNLTAAVEMWPTPTANEDACGKPTGKMQKMLGNHPKVRGTGGGTLNPTWVEWLMGYPAEYTVLKDWAILSSRKSSKKSAKQSSKPKKNETSV
jgi:DNA-cytosine methyltransferase